MGRDRYLRASYVIRRFDVALSTRLHHQCFLHPRIHLEMCHDPSTLLEHAWHPMRHLYWICMRSLYACIHQGKIRTSKIHLHNMIRILKLIFIQDLLCFPWIAIIHIARWDTRPFFQWEHHNLRAIGLWKNSQRMLCNDRRELQGERWHVGWCFIFDHVVMCNHSIIILGIHSSHSSTIVLIP